MSDPHDDSGHAALVGTVGAVAAVNNSSAVSYDDEVNRNREESLNLAKAEAVSKAERLNERNVELRRQSKRLRTESKRLDQESKRLRKKAKRMNREADQAESNADAARDQVDSFDFEILLLRLRRNDKDTVKVGFDIPDGYGKALGEALLHNTMVETIDLYVPAFQSTSSGVEVEKEAEPLLQFISRSESLVDFMAGQGEDESDCRKIADLFLEALSTSKHIERLLWYLPVCPQKFSVAMKNLQSLQELDVTFVNASSYSDDEQRTIAAAFQSSKALRKLELCVEQNVDLYIRKLSSLAAVSTLQELTLKSSTDCDDNFDAAVSQFLRDTSTLRRFEMVGFLLDAAAMTAVLSGLQLQHVSALSLRHCEILEVEGVQLASLLQTRATNNDGETVANSSLRELHISDEIGTALSQTLSSQIASSILEVGRTDDAETALRDPPFLPTIGSQLNSLSLGDVDPSFFSTSKDNAARFRVQNLELSRLSLAACVAFRTCIPFLTSICKLKITKVQNAKGLVLILHGIQNSRSIREVETMDDENDNDVDFSASQLRLIQAYCERNQQLDKLLQIEQPMEGDDSGSGSHGAALTDITATRTAAASLRPPLLVATQQVPNKSTGWSVLTRSLLVLGQSLGIDDNDGSDESEIPREH